jgi:hypothetical protein
MSADQVVWAPTKSETKLLFKAFIAHTPPKSKKES